MPPWTVLEIKLRSPPGSTKILTEQTHQREGSDVRTETWIFPPWAPFPTPDPCDWYFSSPPLFHFESILVCFWSNSRSLHIFPSNYQRLSCALDCTMQWNQCTANCFEFRELQRLGSKTTMLPLFSLYPILLAPAKGSWLVFLSKSCFDSQSKNKGR